MEESTTNQQIATSTSGKLSTRDTETVASVEASERPVNGDESHAAALPPVNASQLRDRTRKKRHTIKKLEKKLEVLHRQIKK
jgi:hypothetical protein